MNDDAVQVKAKEYGVALAAVGEYAVNDNGRDTEAAFEVGEDAPPPMRGDQHPGHAGSRHRPIYPRKWRVDTPPTRSSQTTNERLRLRHLLARFVGDVHVDTHGCSRMVFAVLQNRNAVRWHSQPGQRRGEHDEGTSETSTSGVQEREDFRERDCG